MMALCPLVRKVVRWSASVFSLRPGFSNVPNTGFASESKVGDPIETGTEGKVRLIGLNRPEQRNAVNRHTARELFEAFREFNRDETVHSAVLYGKGENFCAGYDLKELAGAANQGGELLESLGDPHDLENNPAPLVHVLRLIPSSGSSQYFNVAHTISIGPTCTQTCSHAHAHAHERTHTNTCLLYTSPSPRDQRGSRMPSSA